MKKSKIKNFSYVVLIMSVFLFVIVSIRTDFFRKNFFLDTYSYDDLQFPSRYDLRNVSGYNYTSPPKNQFWAACWAFATVGTLESNMMMHNGNSSYYLDYNNDGIY